MLASSHFIWFRGSFLVLFFILSRAESGEVLSDFFDQPRFRHADWGVHVVDCETKEVLFTRHSSRLFTPASNTKLFTAALVLDRFGAAYRIKTPLYTSTPPDNEGVLHGDLLIYGRGDPSFSAQFNEGNHEKALSRLVQTIDHAGITSIRGRLVGLDTFFKGPLLGPGWTWDDLQYYYGASTGALSVVENLIDIRISPGPIHGTPAKVEFFPETQTLQWSLNVVTDMETTGNSISMTRSPGATSVSLSGLIGLQSGPVWEAVTVPEPSLLFMEQLHSHLQRVGRIPEGGIPTQVSEDEDSYLLTDLPLLGVVESPPMGDILTMMMKRSQNMMAHQLLMYAGETRRVPGDKASSSTRLGLDLLSVFMKKTGIEKDIYYFEEGSGLSRANKVSPEAVTTLLLWMRDQDYFETFYQGLPIAGRDGTLRARFRGTPLEGTLRGKTGTLTHVHALSGYMTSSSGKELAFAILLNNFLAGTSREARASLDELARNIFLTQ